MTSENVQFYKLNGSGDIYLYSAFFDPRKQSQHCVRILGMWPNARKAKWAAPSVPPTLYCRFSKPHNKPKLVKGAIYEFNEHHNARFSGFILTCNVSSHPENVTVLRSSHIEDDEGVQLSVIPLVPHLNPSVNMTLCIPPLFGAVKPERLVEFIELNLILGAQKFDFYIYEGQDMDEKGKNISAETLRVLKYYSKKKIARLHYWFFPLKSRSMWYFGQVASLHDCLYKNIGRTKYLSFHDIDEFVIPIQKNMSTLQEMMAKIDDGKHCGYQIKMTYMQVPKNKEPLLSSEKRTADVSSVRTKCIVRPERIFEMGIHHISKQNEERFTSVMVPGVVALVYHYRTCSPKYKFNCRVFSKESVLEKYRQKWFDNTNAVLSELGLRRYFLIE
ncbi:beta-1,4-galactosyltransferase galt-1-like [Lingula anatina]|uniref:Glycosyltransferase family 92 protein n=1 Tax=Lingula anatina TaxID=7574 RepID=A0A1S3KEB1_LINAN|nr:beta-1,4-galactosyltransferase galt-1-like [Lingula anatina]|eukprot:XP_013420963.1 beta-1,4-galactosyltransferase galt-1-like [Lingula anatina]